MNIKCLSCGHLATMDELLERSMLRMDDATRQCYRCGSVSMIPEGYGGRSYAVRVYRNKDRITNRTIPEILNVASSASLGLSLFSDLYRKCRRGEEGSGISIQYLGTRIELVSFPYGHRFDNDNNASILIGVEFYDLSQNAMPPERINAFKAAFTEHRLNPLYVNEFYPEPKSLHPIL